MTGQEVTIMGGSRRRRKSGLRRAAKVRSRRRRLAEEEAARERHARLIVERAGDPRFVQQETVSGGREIRWDAATPGGAELSEALKDQLAAFRTKFGRDPGPDDPLFFDPDADEPTPLSVDAWHDSLDEMIGKADQLGIDPAYLKAARELGYLITEPNRHLFSATEVQAWEDAVTKYQDDDEDVDITEMFDMLAVQLDAIVQETLTRPSPEPARLLADRVAEADQVAIEYDGADADELGGVEGTPGVSMAFAILAAWIAGARDELGTADLAGPVLGWITTHLGESIAALAGRGVGILGAPDAPDLTINQLAAELGRDFIPVMIWLAAGLVAEFGSGDTAWLRRNDIHLNKS